MRARSILLPVIGLCALMVATVWAATSVPSNIKQPGTQPGEVSNLETPDKCDNCHGGYNTATEPAFNWRGSMMANAGRDPIFWATMAIAEQDFDGVGDLCIRCHSTAGWLGGRSTPTDGSALTTGDSDGVECDFCHKATNPNNSEHHGVMLSPFEAFEGTEGYYGSGMASIWGGAEKLGPYRDAAARHQFMQSKFHRSVDFCGTCHDVSNPAVGNLAHNRGTQPTAGPVVADGDPGAASPVDTKAAFNNPPYKYGLVERTFSEYKSGLISQTRVNDYVKLPADLKGGALQAIYNAATKGGTISADYADGDPRYYSCQTCHMRPVTGQGCNKNPPVRNDLALHDMTGGNYWMPAAIQYLDGQGKLRLGGGLTAVQNAALDAAKLRAKEQLELAASLTVEGNSVKVVNHTGHKLISGYPEGRRMWLNIKWYDVGGALLREDGKYGTLNVTLDGAVTQVETILDLHDPNTKIYEAHYGLDQGWAAQLTSLGWSPGSVLAFDRVTGAVTETLGELAATPAGTKAETFHFALNNQVIKDNRIPPYGMDYETARVRNALPVPDTQYGGGPGKAYNYFDLVTLNPPDGAVSATIDLLYQPTSWEYIQFLYLANKLPAGAFLANEGAYMLEAWRNTGMARPHVMASAVWGTPVQQCNVAAPNLLTATPGNGTVALTWSDVKGADPQVAGYRVYYDQAGKSQLVADVGLATTFTDSGLTNGQQYCYKVTAYRSATCEAGFSNILCATPTAPGQNRSGVKSLVTGVYQKSGKGSTATTTFVATSTFSRGNGVVLRAAVVDIATGLSLANATVDIAISGPQALTLTTGPSNSSGIAEVIWQTQAPNRNGSGGTPVGTFTATTANVKASGYTWDGVTTSTTFTLQ